mmetsp:Transcript_20151/g.20944  ORF Transcript_20151/g.20944 Transcript_20151/m.20944 type:complete len:234 (-) Transcript_20151:3-704(-)
MNSEKTTSNKIQSPILIIYSNPENDPRAKKLLDLTLKYYKKEKTETKKLDVDQLEYQKTLHIPEDNNSPSKDNSDNSIKNNLSLFANNIFTLSDKDKEVSLDLIRSSNLTIFIFPLIWSSCPSRLKVWMEICYNEGLGFNDRNYIYSNGHMKGKNSVVFCSNSNNKEDYGYKGKFILSLDETLEHFTHGVLALYGYSVLPTFSVYQNQTDYEEDFIKTLDDLANQEYIHNILN